MPRIRRFNIKAMLANPDLRRKLIVDGTRATQAREGVEVSTNDAENSYYVVTEAERAAFFGLESFRSESGELDGRHIQFVRSLRDLVSPSRIDISLRDFASIEDAPFAYDKLALVGGIFRNFPQIGALGNAWQGVISKDDERYFRYHWEVQPNASARPWVCLHKGGEYSRFYYNSPLVIDWSAKAQSEFHRLRDVSLYFRQGLTWPRRTAKGFNVRFLPDGCVFSDKGPAFLPHNNSSIYYLLGVTNSRIFEFLFRAKTSFSWEIGVFESLPLPPPEGTEAILIEALSSQIYQYKSDWDTGNEICTRFDRPWILRTSMIGSSPTLSTALDAVLTKEAALNRELESSYAKLNDAVYRLYGVNDALKTKFESAIGLRPVEVIWPQMEGKSSEQKRLEHVNRLLAYLVRRITEADNDGLVCLQAVAHESPLLDRLREELQRGFPKQDPNSLETEVVNELKKKVKGYRRTESLNEWLNDAFFEIHANIYHQRPLLWHLASSQTRTVPAFSVVIHAHKFDGDALAKLRSVYIRDRLTSLRREAGQARQDNREEDRLEVLAAIEEVEVFEAKLKLLQEGHRSGPENGDRDYRILTPWKSESDRPEGWNPDLDDGIKVNIAPLARTGLLRIKGRFGEKDTED